MNNDFKKSSYLLTILLFLVGIAALVAVSAAKYFTFDELVVTVSQIVSLLAFFAIFINCIYAKSRYNSACIRFADYILTNRRREAKRDAEDAEREKEMQMIRDEAEHDREMAVEAALRQERSEREQTTHTVRSMPMEQAMPVMMPMPSPQMVIRPPFVGAPGINVPNEEVLYNEYGEPVMMRRRVRKTAYSPDGELLYDGNGNPVIRRNQGLWEPLEQRRETVMNVETSSATSVSQPSRFTPNSEREGDK